MGLYGIISITNLQLTNYASIAEKKMDNSQEEKKQRWEMFNQAWSEPDSERRMELLIDTLNEHYVYSDQHASINGYEALSNYMEGFQKSVPGAKFETLWFTALDYQCLAAWKLVATDGSVLKTGHGYGRYVNAHRLLIITYFLDTKP